MPAYKVCQTVFGGRAPGAAARCTFAQVWTSPRAATREGRGVLEEQARWWLDRGRESGDGTAWSVMTVDRARLEERTDYGVQIYFLLRYLHSTKIKIT